jgi:hypothetical protein
MKKIMQAGSMASNWIEPTWFEAKDKSPKRESTVAL